MLRQRATSRRLLACSPMQVLSLGPAPRRVPGSAFRLLSTKTKRQISSTCATKKAALGLDSLTGATVPKTSVATKPSGGNILPLEIVLNPILKQTILPLLGHTAYLAIVSGFLMTDMLQLRVLLVGGYTGLVAFHTLHERPLRIPLRWSAVFVAVNAVGAALLIRDRFAPSLNTDEHPYAEELYAEHFSTFLTRGQFQQLLTLASRRSVPANTQLTQENVPHDKMYFILQGQANVFHGTGSSFLAQSHGSSGTSIATIEQGGFVNDVAFQRGPNTGAYGTIVTSQPSEIVVWDVDALRGFLKSRPDLERGMKYCMSDHLVKSLLRQRDARQQQQQP